VASRRTQEGGGSEGALLAAGSIERAVLIVRAQKVLLDADLAALYGVETKALNRAVKRNVERFPADFMFQLTPAEVQTLRFQSGTSRAEAKRATKPEAATKDAATSSDTAEPGEGHGGRRYLPYAFTEQGVAMLSSVLHSPRAVQVNIEIMRAFVRLRHILQQNNELSRKLSALERKYDAQFRIVFDAIRELMTPLPGSEKPKRGIGFGKE
jgi:hypothetical protein